MSDELVFRVGMVVWGCTAPLIQIYFGRKARPHQAAYGVKRSTFRSEGRLNFVLHSAAVIGMAIVVFIYVAKPALLAWCSVPLQPFWRWLGMGLAVVSLAGLWEVHRELGRYWSAFLEIQEQHRLITTGIYRRIRHPMYTVIILGFVATSLICSNWLYAALCLARTVLFEIRMRREEAMLTAQFGDEYRNYMHRTGRLLPRFGAGAD